MIYACRKADRRILHHINLNTMLSKMFEDETQIIFSDEGEVLGGDAEKDLVEFDDERRNERLCRHIGPYLCTLPFRLQERPHLQCDILVLKRFDRFRVNDRCAVISQFDSIEVTNCLQLLSVRKMFRVSIQHSLHILPDHHLTHIKAVGKYGGRIITSLPSQGGGIILRCTPDEPLCDDNVLLLPCLIHLFIYEVGGHPPLHFPFPV